MYHYSTFMALYWGHYVPLGMYSGPYLTHGHPGYTMTRGLAGFLHSWAFHLTYHLKFTGKAWAVKMGFHGSLDGSAKHRIAFHFVRVIHRGGHVFRLFIATVGKHHQVLHRTLYRVR